MSKRNHTPTLKSYESMSAASKVVTSWGLAKSAQSYGELAEELPLPARGYSSRLNAWKRVNKIAQVSSARGVFAHAVLLDPGARGVATYQLYQPGDQAAVSAFRDQPSTEVAYWLSKEYEVDLLTHEIVFSALANLAKEKGHGPLWAISHSRDHVKADAYHAAGFKAHPGNELVDVGLAAPVPRVVWEYQATI